MSVRNNRGVHVFESADGNWPATRKIWNQHAYHITNINDDGTIPQYEEHSWLSHNTYRLNTFPDRDPLAVPDLTAGYLRLIDNGIGQSFTLIARIGNAGTLSSSANLTFYLGNPNLNGVELGTVTLSELLPGASQDIHLENVTLESLDQDIYAIVDAKNQVSECNEDNNTTFTPISSNTLHGVVKITLDAELYAINSPVTINYSVTNQGALPTKFKVELRLIEANASTIETLNTVTLNPLAAGETLTLSTNWNTSTTLAGNYQMHALLLSNSGDLVASATQPFTITAEDTLRLQTSLDRTTYHTTDTLLIENRVTNDTVNQVVKNALLRVTIDQWQKEMVLEDLSPRAMINVPISYPFENAEPGTYIVKTEILDQVQTKNYQVENNPRINLNGTVTAQFPTRHIGEEQVCTDTLTGSLTNFAIRQVLTFDKNEISATEKVLEKTQTLERMIPTDGFSIGDYACVLQAQLNGQWQNLDVAPFEIQKPLVSLTGTVSVERKSLHVGDEQVCTNTLTNSGASDLNALNLRQIWLKKGLEINTSEALINIPSNTSQVFQRKLAINEVGQYTCTLQAFLSGQWQTLDQANFLAQKALLEASVSTQSPSVYVGEVQICTDTIINNGFIKLSEIPIRQSLIPGNTIEFPLTLEKNSTFVDERVIETDEVGDYICLLSMQLSGSWNPLAQASFQVEEPPIKISANLTVGHRGRLLILLDGGINDPLGPKKAPTLAMQRAFLESLLADWSYTIVTNAQDFTYEMRSGGYHIYALFSESVKLDKSVQKALREAVFRGEGLIVAGDHDSRNHFLDEPLGVKYKGKFASSTGFILVGEINEFAYEDKGLRFELSGAGSLGVYQGTQDVAASYYEYGQGSSVYVGFDLLAHATAARVDSGFANFLKEALLLAHVGALTQSVGNVVPVRLTLINEGMATSGRAIVELPEDSEVVEPEELIWPFVLDVDQEASFEFWPRLPWYTGVFPVDVLIQTGIDPDFVDYDNFVFSIEVQALPSLNEAIDEALSSNDKNVKKALKYLKEAKKWLDYGKDEKALEQLLKATDYLMKSEEAESVRLKVDQAIRTVAWMVFIAY